MNTKLTRRGSRPWLAATAALACCVSEAQVRLPNVQVPELPPIRLPIDAAGTLNAATDALEPSRIRDLRRLRIRQLLRANRATLESDPTGAPIVRAEITSFATSDASLNIARSLGFTVVREATFPSLDVRMVILSPPPRQSTRAALRRLRRADPQGQYDYNHIYIESGFAAQETLPSGAGSVVISSPSAAKIGLIDAGIANDHPAFAGARIERFGCNEAKPAAHGTAVASLLVGRTTTFVGAAPNATLFAVDVYCGLPNGGSVEKIVSAFAWLNEKKVPVINVSLVGPRNALMQNIVAAMIARGHVIVAAVGNDGPSSPPLFPAAYAGVIGVTGVDAKRKVLLEAVRGPQVYFSAPGTDMSAAGTKGEYVAVRGTSFAAPIVAGLLATKIAELDMEAARNALALYDREAIDLGARGIDKTYGRGLIGESVRVAPAKLAATKK